MSLPVWLRALTGGWRRRKKLARIEAALEKHLPLLPLVEAQLRDVNRQVEQAVTQVGANFGHIAAGARESVEDAARMVGAGAEGSDGMDSLLAASRSTLEDLLQRIVDDSELCSRLDLKMTSLEVEMRKIVSALADVDRISFNNTILALNARIEAAHLGERGTGFEIVAQELSQQARRSEEITATIRESVGRLSERALTAVSEIRTMTCADGAKMAALRDEVQQALDRLEGANSGLRQSVAAAGDRSRVLAGEIAAAVQTLQFQDRVSQRILHVVGGLESFRAALDGGPGDTDVAARLLQSYTMDGERAIHAAATGEAASAGPELDDVEIF